MEKKSNKYIKEYMISKNNKTLGELRNISLSYVPNDAIFTTWDDDDWRSPNYLENLYAFLINNKADITMIQNRLEFNLNNNSMWKSSMRSGFMTFFMIKDSNIKYDKLDTLEDVIIKKNAIDSHKKIIPYNNNPELYIRYIHKNNTSPYVNKNKAKITKYSIANDYTESDVTLDEQKYIQNINLQFYSKIFA
ncbi:MAG: glycosyltransferase [Rickettsia endosymbiont of Ixodes persulcatus]|nr:glycosyltransferase [Rickettsia endosymbiont of Ixodes persulcatus]